MRHQNSVFNDLLKQALGGVRSPGGRARCGLAGPAFEHQGPVYCFALRPAIGRDEPARDRRRLGKPFGGALPRGRPSGPTFDARRRQCPAPERGVQRCVHGVSGPRTTGAAPGRRRGHLPDRFDGPAAERDGRRLGPFLGRRLRRQGPRGLRRGLGTADLCRGHGGPGQ